MFARWAGEHESSARPFYRMAPMLTIIVTGALIWIAAWLWADDINALFR
jgi:hypothetical protein